MKYFKLSENAQIKGYWWLPESPDYKVPGDLFYEHEKKLQLELNGALGSSANPVKEPEIILGVTSKGENVTFADCYASGFSMGMPGYQTETYYGHFFIFGYHFNKLSEIRFKRFFIRFKYLDSWINQNGFLEYDTNYPTGKTSLVYETPKEKILFQNNSYKIILHYFFKRPSKIYAKNSTVNFVEEKRLVIEFRNRVNYKKYLHLISILKNFLSLATSETVIPIEINATIFTKRINQPKFDTVLTSFIYRYQFFGISFTESELRERGQLFTYPDIKDDIKIYLKNWIDKFEQLEAVHELYFSIVNNPNLYLKSKFLNLIYALESYHRQITSTDTTLRNRLEAILNRHRSVKVLFIRNNDQFLDRIINTRNYFTHYDERKKRKALKGFALINHTKILMALLETCLLSEMGMSDGQVKSLFIKNDNYPQIKAT